MVAELVGFEAAFGVSLGDISGDELSLYGRINRLIGAIGVPWYAVPGNHDINYESPDNSQTRETFHRVYRPNYYSFEYGGVLFVVLDNVNYRDYQKRITLDSRFHGQRQSSQLFRHPGEVLSAPVSKANLPSTSVVVNFFNGADDSKVELTIDDNAPVPMTRYVGEDPLFIELHQRHPRTFKYWIEPSPTGHLWRTRLPADLKPGVHTLTVKAVDAYGNVFTQHRILEIVDYGD